MPIKASLKLISVFALIISVDLYSRKAGSSHTPFPTSPRPEGNAQPPSPIPSFPKVDKLKPRIGSTTQFSEKSRLIKELLSHPSPWFCTKSGEIINRTAIAMELYSQLSEADQKLFRKVGESEAQLALSKALLSGGTEELIQVVQAHRFTDPGDQALQRVIWKLFDNGENIAAEPYFTQWLSQATLSELGQNECKRFIPSLLVKGMYIYRAVGKDTKPLSEILDRCMDKFSIPAAAKTSLNKLRQSLDQFPIGEDPTLKQWEQEIPENLLQDQLRRESHLRSALTYSNQAAQFTDDLLKTLKGSELKPRPSFCDLYETGDLDESLKRSNALGLFSRKIPELMAKLEGRTIGDLDVENSAIEALARLGDKAVPTLIANLSKQDERVVNALGKMGEGAKTVVPALIKALSDKNSKVRENAANALIPHVRNHATRTLSEKEKNAHPALPALVAALGDENFLVRHAAAEALGEMNDIAVPDLLTALSKGNENVKSSVVTALGALGEKNPTAIVPAFITALSNENASVRLTTAEALGRIGERAHAAIPALIKAFSDEDPTVGAAAAEALGKIGDKAVADLITSLNIGDTNVKVYAASALGMLGKNAHTAVPALIAALNKQDSHLKLSAATALGKIGEKAHTAVPALITALSNENENVKTSAAEALGAIGSKAKDAVPALTKAFRESKGSIKTQIAQALGRMGQNADAAVPDLLTALRSPKETESVKSSAAEALGGMNSNAAVPDLVAALGSKSEMVNNSAAEALAMIGKKSPTAVEALTRALGDKQADVRSHAATTLGEIGEQAHTAVPALIKALRDEDRKVKAFAMRSLAKIGGKAIPELIKTVETKEGVVAAKILGEMGQRAHTAIPALIKAFGDKDPQMRSSVVSALGRIGPTNEEALAVLRMALKDEDEIVKIFAKEALAHITGEPVEGGILR